MKYSLKSYGFEGYFFAELIAKSMPGSPCLFAIMRGYHDMKNYIFGYARVSTEQQNLDRQIDALEKYGVDIVYNEKMTGTKNNEV